VQTPPYGGWRAEGAEEAGAHARMLAISRMLFENEVRFRVDGVNFIASSAAESGTDMRLGAEAAARVITDALYAADLDWRLLELLRLEDHPPNVHPPDLLRMVKEAIYRERLTVKSRDPFCWRPVQIKVPPEPPRAAPDTVRAYIVVETVDVSGGALADVPLEIIAPDVSLHAVRSGLDGSARIDGVPPGVCRVRLPRHDASAWRALNGGSAQLAERRPSRRHVVVAGECLSVIAQDHGLANWQSIWEAPDNAALRALRQSPHVICPGDVLVVPGLQVAELACCTDASHRIEVATPWLELKLVLADHHGRPFRAHAFQLWLEQADGEPYLHGSTDGDGCVEARLPAGTRVVFVLLEKQGLVFPLQLSAVAQLPTAGAAPTPSDMAAVQARLNALGIGAGPITGDWSVATERALRTLRRARGEVAGGPLTADDLDALRAFGV
jgi:hypothetical protein